MTPDSQVLRAQALEALAESGRLLRLACEHYEEGEPELAQKLRRAAEIKDEEAKRILSGLV